MKRTVILSSFISEVCTKLDFEQLFLSHLDCSLVTEVSQLNAWSRAREQMDFFCPFDFLFGHIINLLLTKLGRSVWENLDLGRWYRPHWGGHWGLLETAQKITQNRKTEIYFDQNRTQNHLMVYSPHFTHPNFQNPNRSDTWVRRGAYGLIS